MAASSEIGIGIVGFGFMGRTHLAAYESARTAGWRCRIAGVCDVPGRVCSTAKAGNLATGAESLERAALPEAVDFDALLADEDVQLVSVCTPTDTHVELALRALDAGKHVLVEKPVALSSADVQRLADAAERAGTFCLPAMCMRFWPGWSWLRERIDRGTFGAVDSAAFRRLGGRPGWSPEFYGDPARSGGALFDLHVHDADFVRHCFGDPAAVSSAGTHAHVTTLYRYPAGPSRVVAEGAWERAGGLPFLMYYRVAFEEATVEFDLTRTPHVLVARAGATEPVELEPLTAYEQQARHMLALIDGQIHAPRVTMSEAVAVMRLLEAERQSMQTSQPVGLGAHAG